jgi:glutathionylspermidine synthase
MERIKITPRTDWQKKVEALGFSFHSLDTIYWDESVAYEFTMDEILELERVTNKLHQMCLEAVQYVIDNNMFYKLQIPDDYKFKIIDSWNNDLPAIYGRFDLAYKNGEIKLLEYNADTPTSLFEAAVVQWYWLQDYNSKLDQFNSIHERLINYWKYLKPYLKNKAKVHFSCISDSLEDTITTEYMRDTATQAGLETDFIYIEDIGWDWKNNMFVDWNDVNIDNLFKLYPWEWLIHEEFGNNILREQYGLYWIEPAWKMILSNKGILPVLYELNPSHPNLLKSYFDKTNFAPDENIVKKPMLSREGANIEITKNRSIVEKTYGDYGAEGYIYQEFFDVSKDGKYPVLGSWVIGGEAGGMGIRESDGLITDNLSRFIPHYIRK